MPWPLLPLSAVLLGLAIAAGGMAWLRRSGASFGLGRRLAGAQELKVGDLLSGGPVPPRPVRVNGRVRCPDPIVTERDERLVAFHRDVEVRLPRGGWRTIERLRETRTFELWDHDGSLSMDPAAAAEPLISIPHVWRGEPAELDATFQPAIARLTAEHGAPTAARATTRMLSMVDRMLVLARVEHGKNGGVSLVPPPGGYVISSLELDAGLRLLGGRRGRLLGGVATVVAGVLVAAIGLVTWIVGLVDGGPAAPV
ncbi:MAG: hypothetical protein ABI622_01760 [Chloroflexota bacterium]